MKTKAQLRNMIFDEMKRSKNNSVHQAIMNICYNDWQLNKNWDYQDFLDFVNYTYGDLFVFAIQAGNLNYQVNNGGWSQYFFNGYGTNGLFVKYLDKFKELFVNDTSEIVTKAINLFSDIGEPDEDGIPDIWDDYYYKIEKKLNMFLENYFNETFIRLYK